MTINKKTKMRDILPLLNEERIQRLVTEIPPQPLDAPLLKLTVAQFIEAMDERFALSFFEREKYAFAAFGKYRQYLSEMEGVTNFLKKYEVEQDADEKVAAQGVDFPTIQERMLLDCVRFYHLNSTEQAERLPLVDWLLVVKSQGTTAQYQRNMSKINQQRNKNGR